MVSRWKCTSSRNDILETVKHDITQISVANSSWCENRTTGTLAAIPDPIVVLFIKQFL